MTLNRLLKDASCQRAAIPLFSALIVCFCFITFRIDYSFGSPSSSMNIVSCSAMIDTAADFDALYSWLHELNYTKFTFVIWSDARDYILDNATRVSTLKQFGKIIPRLEYVQQNDTDTRKSIIDNWLASFTLKVGYTPDGMMNYQPDTYSCNYLLSKGLKYVQGYCFDQWCIDYMTERGGFQMPYYANSTNAMVPSESAGIVILPHSTWDWIASFTIGHNIHLHPVNLVSLFNNDTVTAKRYFLDLIDNTFTGSSPFGFAQFQFEWSWCVRANLTGVVKDWINTLVTRSPTVHYVMWDFSSLVSWFTNQYQTTPEYQINFTSPYDHESIEWYYSIVDRVARVDNYVVSFIDYTEQEEDKYLTSTKRIDWPGSASDPDNCVDTSLKYEIDALGGGDLRAPPIEAQKMYYASDLRSFHSYYYKIKGIPEIGPLAVGIAMVPLTIIVFILTKSIKSK